MSTLAYIDTSAAVKFLVDESESAALLDWEDDPDMVMVSTDILVVELGRFRLRHHLDPRAVDKVVDSINIEHLTPADHKAAGNLPGESLRSLDALHLRGAQATGADVVITYDDRMIAAAGQIGLAVIHPGKS
ncbi:MAG: type II toxin-antitoxin system VapC family toxin [Micrococcales bacterium]|nr:type II toxin-antitoxin system VapC family toxin [Micrococcales bacterium]